MKISLRLDKDNADILRKIKEKNAEINYEVVLRENMIIVTFTEMRIDKIDYRDAPNKFYNELLLSLSESEIEYELSEEEESIVIKELVEKSVLLKLTLDNTIKYKRYKENNDGSNNKLLNELIAFGLENLNKDNK
ncbi:MAG: hypothetical protein N4A40_12820 [Tissierellales bacterium]|jgi:hypothetical protein|nr:hypothetical protein [Tissierellales bacterium]